jgi:hypothetical protein
MAFNSTQYSARNSQDDYGGPSQGRGWVSVIDEQDQSVHIERQLKTHKFLPVKYHAMSQAKSSID